MLEKVADSTVNEYYCTKHLLKDGFTYNTLLNFVSIQRCNKKGVAGIWEMFIELEGVLNANEASSVLKELKCPQDILGKKYIECIFEEYSLNPDILVFNGLHKVTYPCVAKKLGCKTLNVERGIRLLCCNILKRNSKKEIIDVLDCYLDSVTNSILIWALKIRIDSKKEMLLQSLNGQSTGKLQEYF